MARSDDSGPFFSKRTGWGRAPNLLSERVRELCAGGLTDLTESNPTRVGLAQPQFARLLGDVAGATYAPVPLGAPDAREAIARYSRARGGAVDASHIVLTSSTSESYSWLFKLLCDAGDVVMTPRPCYPLFSYLAELEAVELASYPLLREEGWRIDHDALLRRLDDYPRARAIVMVHPGNPTGSLVTRADADFLFDTAKSRGLALVIDEVFLDYLHATRAEHAHPTFAGRQDALCFVASGLSKVALLPQHKLGWMSVSGPRADEAMARLELIADSYLPVSTAVQIAAPAILDAVEPLQSTVCARLGANLAAIDRIIAAEGGACPVRRVSSDGGWYAMLEVPRTKSDEQWALMLLERARILVHPGYLFDMDAEGAMVVSLLVEPERFEPAMQRAVELWSRG